MAYPEVQTIIYATRKSRGDISCFSRSRSAITVSQRKTSRTLNLNQDGPALKPVKEHLIAHELGGT